MVDRLALDRDLLAGALATAAGFALVLAAPTLVPAPIGGTVDAVVIRAGAPGPDLPAEVTAAAELEPRPRIVVVAGFVDAYLVERLEAVGADVVVSTDLPLAGLLELVRGASAEPAARPDRAALARRHHLTTRELEILDHLAEGRAPGQIAQLLEIRVSTIRDHIKSLRTKLGCTSATQIVIAAHRLGLAPQVGRPLR